MKGSEENGKSQKHSQASEEGCVPSSQDSHPSSSPIGRCAFCGKEFYTDGEAEFHINVRPWRPSI